MKVGVLSDIHGNRVALDAVLADMPSVDALVCAGDVVGYNPWHADCVETVRERGVSTVSGNHDRAVADVGEFAFNSVAAAGVDHAREQLSAGQIEWLRSLPTERWLFEERLRLVHGHPADPDRYTYAGEFSGDLLDGADALVLGHTHAQEHREVEGGVVLNPGSVGQPRDGDPRAAYAVLDMETLTVDEHRVEYDIDAVMDAVEEAGLPHRIGKRLYGGR
jgi:putative phosphoesterase